MDAAAACETDVNGVLTANGTYWKASTATPVLYGVVGPSALQLNTSSMRTTLYTDAARTIPATGLVEGQYNGYGLRITTGTASGAIGTIRYFTTVNTLFSINSGLASAPGVGDYFEVIYDIPCDDAGTHPLTYMHMTIANSFAEGLLNL